MSHGVPCITTLSGILAAIQGIEALRENKVGVRSLQEYHADLDAARAHAARARTSMRPMSRTAGA